MPDSKDNRGQQDRSRVSGEQDYEVQHIAERLRVSAEQVREAIKAVGNSREAVENYLRRGKEQ